MEKITCAKNIVLCSLYIGFDRFFKQVSTVAVMLMVVQLLMTYLFHHVPLPILWVAQTFRSNTIVLQQFSYINKYSTWYNRDNVYR